MKLKLARYDAVSTTSGAKAIELIRSERFDIVLLDLLMPGMSGKDVFDNVRTFSPVPIIIFSAKQDIVDIAKKMGVDDSFSKPLNPDYLPQKVEAVLGKRNEGN